MTYQETDLVKFVFLLAATRLNSCAAFILFLHVISVFLLNFVNYNPIGAYCLIAVLFCASASSEIKAFSSEIRISSSIRYVLFAIGVLNFGAAMEFYAFSYKTSYYYALPSMINALDIIIIALLLTGGRGFVGFTVLHYIRARLASFNARYLRYNPQDKVLQTKGYHKK